MAARRASMRHSVEGIMSAPVRELDYNGPSRDGPLNYAPQKIRRSARDEASVSVLRKAEAPPRIAAPEAFQPSWSRKKQRQAFAGDVAMAELHNRLALTPDRMPDPPLPVTIVPP